MSHATRWVALITVVASATGCATAHPDLYAYPQKGQTVELAARDQAECETWAKQQSGFDPGARTGTGAVIGAVVGALGGAAPGAAVGAGGGAPRAGAGGGAAAGGGGGGGGGA